MNWDELKKLDYKEIYLTVQEARAELMYEAFCKSRDLSEWAQYLKDHPPSPETLAVLVVLGLEKHHERLRVKGGKGKGAKTREIIENAIANRGDKTPKQVKLELVDMEIAPRTIQRHTSRKLPKKAKT
jgi:hypothetical protein